VVVDLKVNVIQRKETVTNVIGSIYGDMEPGEDQVLSNSKFIHIFVLLYEKSSSFLRNEFGE
jgi:hypothetical protein